MPSSSRELSTPTSPTPPAEASVVGLARVLVAGAGAFALLGDPRVPWWIPPAIIACIALPTKAGEVIDLVRGKR